MFVRRESWFVMFLALPLLAVPAAAQRAADDSTAYASGAPGLPRLGLLPVAATAAEGASWDCVGRCPAPQRLSPVGAVEPAPTLLVAHLGHDEVSVEPVPRGVRQGNGGTPHGMTPASWPLAAARSRGGVPANGAHGEVVHLAGEAAPEDAAADAGSRSRAPALFATAAVGAAAVLLATNGGGRAPFASVSGPGLGTSTPTLTLQGPLMQPATPAPVTQVPEPGTWALLLTGVAGLAMRRVRRSR